MNRNYFLKGFYGIVLGEDNLPFVFFIRPKFPPGAVSFIRQIVSDKPYKSSSWAEIFSTSVTIIAH
jgi:hypothetical protein